MNLKTIAADTGKPSIRFPIYAKQGDIKSRYINISLLNNGYPFDIPDGAVAIFNARRADSEAKAFYGEIKSNTVTVELNSWVLEIPGTVECDVSIIYNGKKLTSATFQIGVEKAVYTNGDIAESADYDILTELINSCSAAADKANAAIKEAQTYLVTDEFNKKVDNYFDDDNTYKLYEKIKGNIINDAKSSSGSTFSSHKIEVITDGLEQKIADVQKDVSDVSNGIADLQKQLNDKQMYKSVELSEDEKKTDFGYILNSGDWTTASTSLTGYIFLNAGAKVIRYNNAYSVRISRYNNDGSLMSTTNYDKDEVIITASGLYRIGNINGQYMRPATFNETFGIYNTVPAEKKNYTVDINGNGDYTSFTACLKALANDTSEKTITVLSGTYNIFEEMGGSDFALSVTSNDKWRDVCPIVPSNTKITGIGEVVFNYLPEDEQTNEYAAGLISVLNISGNVTVENLKIYGKNCRYIIHDETSAKAEFRNTVHKYRNVKCRKESSTYGYGQAFGCGYDDGLTFVFENCLFDSQQGGAGLSMHNTNGYGSNNVTFTDCQFISSGVAALSFYNSGTVQLYNTVNISNCYLNKMLALSINGDLNASGRINAYKLYINNCNDFTVYTRPNLTNNLEATVYNTIKS